MPFDVSAVLPQDEFEAFLLDFLLYRRDKKNVPAPVKTQELDTPLLTSDIGKGWPHYRPLSLPVSNEEVETSKNEIICLLEPIVKEMVTHFGKPIAPKDFKHINHQVIARAMSMPAVGEIMRATESKPWGRVALLQTVVTLLINLFINNNRVVKSKDTAHV